jgi:RimJ/RimL family protein N-acetyltransferase
LSSEPAAQYFEPKTLHSRGDRVWIGPVHERDIAPYRRAVEQSRTRLIRWNPVDPDDLARALPLQSRERRTFLIHALTPEGEHDIVGKINVVDAVRGRFQSAGMGYDAYDPYAGRGFFSEGLRLVLNLAFTPEPEGGMGLHRVQATVQPGNVRSAGLLRSLGFSVKGSPPACSGCQVPMATTPGGTMIPTSCCEMSGQPGPTRWHAAEKSSPWSTARPAPTRAPWPVSLPPS